MQQEFLGPAPLHPRDNNNQRKTIPLKDFEAKKKEINELLNSKAKELKELGLLDKLGEFVGIQTDNAKQRESQLNDIKDVAVKNKTDFKDLPSALKDEYYNKAETSILKPLKTKNEIAKEDYQKDLQRQAILQKTTQELTQNDKELIDNDSGFFNRALDAITGKSEVEKLKEYKEKEKAKDITKDLQKSWNLFNSLRKDKDAFSLFASEDLQLREKYQNEFKNIARNSGFDDVVYNEKHEPFVRKGDKFYKINDRFFDNFLNFLSANKFSLSGSLIGAASGAKAGKNLGALGLLGGAIVGGALGSTAGGATDAIAGNAFLNREQKADEIIRHALSDGALSLVTDTLVLGAGKFIKKAINPRSIFNIGANASTGGLYALGKHIVTGNAKGAEIILNETISENERQAVRELAKRFGGELRLSKADESKYREELIKKVGEDSKILKGYDALRDAFLLQSQAKKQEAFIQAIRSDETGNAVAFLSEAANSSPIANANLKKILNKTTENLKNSLRQLDLKDYEVKSIFDNLEQGTKESYEKALDGVIGKLYDNSYKTNLRESIQDATAFETFVKELKEQGKFDPTASSFLNQIEKNIYSPEGVTYNQLRNARQMINAYERNVKDPSTLGYIKKINAQFLREDIDKGIENILKQNTQAYEKLSDLNKTAISDYKNMKQTLELVDSAKIRNREITKEKAIENLMKVIQAQGEKDLSNYALLTKGLSEQDKEKLELSMLNALMEKSIKQGENLKVFDSTHFFNKLNEFRNEVFTTPKAKQYINIAKGFDKLFRNDATIAGKINYTTTKDIKSPLATSLEGAFNQKLTQKLVSNIVRNIPTTHIFKKLDELSGGAALKYHIQKALERSHTISAFTKNLELSAKNSKFSNATMRKIEEITQGVKSAKENITKQKKALQDAITPLKQFGKNYAEFVLKPKEALEKLLQEKNGQVAGAAFRDDLGGIDFVWGKDGKDGYGLAHILEKREKQYTRLGLNTEQVKERTDELLKSIPEVIENGALFKDDLGRVSVELHNIRVGLKNTWDNNNLNNHFVVTSYERDEKVLRELETKPPLSNDYKDNSNYSALNLNENNSTKESLKSQEPPLSILEKSQLEKQKKLESERLAKAEKERIQKIKDKEKAELRNKIRAQKNATIGKSELDREIAKGENIPYKETENVPKTSVSLNDDEIHLLKFVIVNKSDLKPNFKNTATQTRTAVDSKKVEEIAKRFDPKLIIGRGGFDDLPIILQDGQIIAGNHRIQGMLNFNAESRKKYEQAIKENLILN
ncbi:KHP30-like phage protein [Helicobacter pylori NY40]|uniref:KHP30-like phage protein n=2 Tax=Helicobacter pylori TaxID=210 RepID=A0A060PR79_HELPX|nr:KHP30-like phage protein [Helicobacter pylori]BAO97551.1 KHP30-like phage protein [Helicobacter pylori NY40]